jgi:DNA-binding transcriptional MerR regulator
METARMTAAAAPAPRVTSLMSIGEVLATLREDFPDVTISKLRFLEAEGLIEPQRTPAGYRKYSRADVTRLRYVLEAQRDRFLPLRVIREHLAALDAGDAPPMLTAVGSGFTDSAGDPGLRATEPPLPPGDVRLRRAELLAKAGLTDKALTELEDNLLVTARGADSYDGDALAIATVAASLARYGLGARHLRAYRAAADREVGTFAALVAPLARASTPAARARAAEAVRELTSLSAQLHAALVRIGLRETLGG